MSRKITLAVLVACSFALTAVVAQATIISVDVANPSFELAVLGASQPSYKGIDDWTLDPNIDAGGRMKSSGYPGYPAAHSGNQYAYLQCGDKFMHQELMVSGLPFEVTAAGDSITVDVYQAVNGSASSQNFGIVLLKGDLWGTTTPIATEVFTDLPTPTNNTWMLRTLTYVSTTADLNVPLWLELANWDTVNQVLVDDVAVSYTPVPEPGTLLLLATGLIGLLCYAWRKRK